MKNKKLKSKKIIFIYLLLIIILIAPIFSYYVNVYIFFETSKKNDGYGGLAQERNQSDFIVDGCGTNTMLDVITGLCWQKDFDTGGEMTWANAISYCDTLDLGGHSDWSLPSNNQLMTLIDEIGVSGATEVTLESFGFLNIHSTYYWSSSEYVPDTSKAWLVRFNTGHNGSLYAKTSAEYVVCVREDS